MIRYLVVRYLLALVGAGSPFVLSNMLFGGSVQSGVARGLCWGSFGAACMTYFDFRRRNLWILYDNLRIPKHLILGGLAFLFYAIGVGLSLK
jgi:hypothetical protein